MCVVVGVLVVTDGSVGCDVGMSWFVLIGVSSVAPLSLKGVSAVVAVGCLIDCEVSGGSSIIENISRFSLVSCSVVSVGVTCGSPWA
jgi:hypothetical protein